MSGCPSADAHTVLRKGLIGQSTVGEDTCVGGPRLCVFPRSVSAGIVIKLNCETVKLFTLPYRLLHYYRGPDTSRSKSKNPANVARALSCSCKVSHVFQKRRFILRSNHKKSDLQGTETHKHDA